MRLPFLRQLHLFTRPSLLTPCCRIAVGLCPFILQLLVVALQKCIHTVTKSRQVFGGWNLSSSIYDDCQICA
jgi:hypothetical protein